MTKQKVARYWDLVTVITNTALFWAIITLLSEEYFTYIFVLFCPEDGGLLSSEMSVTIYRTTLYHISKDSNLQGLLNMDENSQPEYSGSSPEKEVAQENVLFLGTEKMAIMKVFKAIQRLFKDNSHSNIRRNIKVAYQKRVATNSVFKILNECGSTNQIQTP
jgi:hypothetical protein